MSDAKREQLKDKIAAAKARNEERDKTFGEQLSEARDTAVSFVKEHPLSVLAGAAAVGVLVSALFPRSPTRKLGKQAAGKASALAALATEFAMLYGEKALNAADDARKVGMDRLEDLGDAAGDTARSLKRDAGYLAGGASDRAKSLARDAGKKARRAARSRLN